MKRKEQKDCSLLSLGLYEYVVCPTIWEKGKPVAESLIVFV